MHDDDQALIAAEEVAATSSATGVEPVVAPSPPTGGRWQSLLGLGAGVLVLGGLSIAFMLFPIDWQAIGSWGYLGIFAVVFVATASVAVPIPYLLIIARTGSYLDPFAIAAVAGLAGMLGELTGYLVGRGGSGLVPHGRWYARAAWWIENYGFWCIAFFACVPNPFFDAVGIVAGTLRYSWKRFAVACFLGKAVKFLVAALVGVEIARYHWGG